MGRRKKNQEESVEETVVENDTAEEVIPVSAAEGNSDIDAKIKSMEEQIQTLTQALLLSRQEVKNPEDEAVIGITRTGGGRLQVKLTDAYGRSKTFKWDKVGDTLYLTPAQYEEFQESHGAQVFVQRGFLSPEKEAVHYVTPRKMIEQTEADALSEVIEEINDPSRLIEILNYIEAERIITNDPETGKPYVDNDGLPRAEVKQLDAKHRLAASMCADRVYTLTGVRYSLTDG